MATRASEVPAGTQVGRWTKREHELFLEGLQRFGKSWKKISSLVHSRTLVQIRTHAQKYLQKQSRAALKADAKAAVAVDKAPQKMLPKPQQLSSVSKLDQLLQEDNNGSIPAFVDEYYSSPTAIEDDLLRSLYSAEPQWVPRFTLAGGPANHPAKRRRLDLNTSASALSLASTPAVVLALRPPFSSDNRELCDRVECEEVLEPLESVEEYPPAELSDV
ncbi:hypothetical protein BBJ29_009467 [Phytophthora kernoviae]|uniref:Uncharacterized protein n=1 Tax=Phytophthora kernoviae TaxID=325452 RepID=A0A3F2RWE1_9STRA|nr:hypothetical protein BBJ29_009467 [Phytophthora kernoviae]RLN64695.1 hypothetical protein BBP00_00003282 [Phytophthora kernoviae]